MEPGHEDREDIRIAEQHADFFVRPQWSPVTKTVKTTIVDAYKVRDKVPQWSPVTKTGKTARP
jgi:hypothetical protein